MVYPPLASLVTSLSYTYSGMLWPFLDFVQLLEYAASYMSAENTHHLFLYQLLSSFGPGPQCHFLCKRVPNFFTQLRNVAISSHNALDFHDQYSYEVFKNSSVTCHHF